VAEDVPVWIVGDQHRLRQIVLNLVGNAVKFTDRGWVKVIAKVDRDQETPMVSIAVSDSGIGIAQDRLAMIFDEFTQADSSTARKFGGTGLGLSISAQLAQMLGGDIKVTSVLHEGTSFKLHLPLVESAAPQSLETVDVGPTDQIVPSPSQRRVLIAEDHDINQVLILALLKRIGIDADIASNGEEVIAMVGTAAASGRPYRMVIMDIQMPIMDGLEATRRLRAAGFNALRLPIIALTANAYEDDIAACFKAGMQAHLSKPVRLRKLEDLAAVYASDIDQSEPNIGLIEGLPIATDVSLTDRYQSRKVQTIGALERLLRNRQPSEMNIKDLLDQLHKLAGTAGSFGDNALGEAAAQLEHALRNAKRSQVKKILAQQAVLFGLAA
jgi:CheY-like chemotaxis protein